MNTNGRCPFEFSSCLTSTSLGPAFTKVGIVSYKGSLYSTKILVLPQDDDEWNFHRRAPAVSGKVSR